MTSLFHGIDSVAMNNDIRIGTQGWNYEAWVGPFYPSGTRPADFLTVYSRAFSTVEVDSTFYRVPDAATWARTLFIEALGRAGIAVTAPVVGANNETSLPAMNSYPA